MYNRIYKLVEAYNSYVRYKGEPIKNFGSRRGQVSFRNTFDREMEKSEDEGLDQDDPIHAAGFTKSMNRADARDGNKYSNVGRDKAKYKKRKAELEDNMKAISKNFLKRGETTHQEKK
jgi:hypothetical protein